MARLYIHVKIPCINGAGDFFDFAYKGGQIVEFREKSSEKKKCNSQREFFLYVCTLIGRTRIILKV